VHNLDRSIPDHRVEPVIKAHRVAAIAHMSVRGVYTAAQRGDFPAVRVGRSLLFPTREILAVLKLLPMEESQAAPGPSVPPEVMAKITRYRAVGLASSAIARALNADDVPRPGGEQWTCAHVEALVAAAVRAV
jgi:predicted DNA-binding transcriptional regulator AlpA